MRLFLCCRVFVCCLVFSHCGGLSRCGAFCGGRVFSGSSIFSSSKMFSGCRVFRPAIGERCAVAIALTDRPISRVRPARGIACTMVQSAGRRMRIRANHAHTGRCFDAQFHLSAPDGNNLDDDLITDLDRLRWFSSQYEHRQAVVQ